MIDEPPLEIASGVPQVQPFWAAFLPRVLGFESLSWGKSRIS